MIGGAKGSSVCAWTLEQKFSLYVSVQAWWHQTWWCHCEATPDCWKYLQHLTPPKTASWHFYMSVSVWIRLYAKLGWPFNSAHCAGSFKLSKLTFPVKADMFGCPLLTQWSSKMKPCIPPQGSGRLQLFPACTEKKAQNNKHRPLWALNYTHWLFPVKFRVKSTWWIWTRLIFYYLGAPSLRWWKASDRWKTD